MSTSTTNVKDVQRYQAAGITFTIDARYTNLKIIGQGAYGVVVSAMDTRKNRKVAIKKVLQPFANLLFAKRLLREIKILRKMKHDNVIRLFDLQLPEDKSKWDEVYMVTDLMETDIYQIIKSQQELSAEHVQYFLLQILKGINYIHSANVMHRDLKPSNILINKTCDIKICDLGLARTQGDSQEMTDYVVTRWYRAPELLLNDKSYSKAVDMWSIGCIFAELLNRRPLFPGKNYLDQLHKIVSVVGTPNATTMHSMNLSIAQQKTLLQIPSYTKYNYQKLFPNASTVALDLLERLLTFDPKQRIAAAEALDHPYFGDLDTVAVTANFVIDFSFENNIKSIPDVQNMLYDEIVQFHNELDQQDDNEEEDEDMDMMEED